MSRRISTLVVLTLLVAAACGQKDGVHVATAGGAPSGGAAAGPATTAGNTSVETVRSTKMYWVMTTPVPCPAGFTFTC